MNKLLIFSAVLIILAIVVGPVALAQLASEEPRQYRRVYLADLEYTEVFFRNEAQDLDLAGMLFVPDGEGPFPAVVIIHGSRESKRDKNWYMPLAVRIPHTLEILADSFTHAGLLMLLLAKRSSI